MSVERQEEERIVDRLAAMMTTTTTTTRSDPMPEDVKGHKNSVATKDDARSSLSSASSDTSPSLFPPPPQELLPLTMPTAGAAAAVGGSHPRGRRRMRIHEDGTRNVRHTVPLHALSSGAGGGGGLGGGGSGSGSGGSDGGERECLERDQLPAPIWRRRHAGAGTGVGTGGAAGLERGGGGGGGSGGGWGVNGGNGSGGDNNNNNDSSNSNSNSNRNSNRNNYNHAAPAGLGAWKAKTLRRYRERTCSDWVRILLPAMRWLPFYDWRHDFVKDLVAGLTVGVMVVPQAMSYAKLAGLPVQYGLYSAFVPVYAYAAFGSSRQLAVGPVALMSLLLSTSLTHVLNPTASSANGGHGGAGAGITTNDPDYHARYEILAIQATFLVGIIYVAMGLLRLGFVTIFLSHAVVSGFTTGAAVIIGFSQLKYILGYDVKRSDVLHEILHHLFQNIAEFNWKTFLLGMSAVVALVLMKHVGKSHPRFKWVRAVGPLTVTAFSILIAWAANLEEKGIPIVGTIPRGLPTFTAKLWTPIPHVGQLFWSVLSMVIVGFMESIAIAKTLATKHKYNLDSSLELIGLGMSNFLGAMFQSYPVTGSFSRSAVNNESGAVSGLSGAVTATLVMLVLLFMTPVFEQLPLCILAAIVISGVLGLLDYTEAMYLWKVHKLDFCIWVIACLGTVFLGVELGLAIAVGLSILLVIYESAYPHTAVLGRLPGTTVYRNVKQYPDAERYDGIVVARIDAPMYFANTQNVREKLIKYENMARRGQQQQQYQDQYLQQQQSPLSGGDGKVEVGTATITTSTSSVEGARGAFSAGGAGVGVGVEGEELVGVRYVILELSPVSHVDTSALHMLHELLRDYERRSIRLCLCNPNKHVMEKFRLSGFADEVGYDRFFVNVHDAVDSCLAEMDAEEEEEEKKKKKEEEEEEEEEARDTAAASALALRAAASAEEDGGGRRGNAHVSGLSDLDEGGACGGDCAEERC